MMNRRVVLGTGCTLLAGVMLPRVFADAAGGVNIGMRAFTAIFPGGEGIYFDHTYYRDIHLMEMQSLYGTALQRVEMRRPLVAGNSPSPYSAIVHFWIPDPEAFALASVEHGQAMVQDRAHFTNGEQRVQSEIVYAETGMAAEAILPGTRCLTVLYPFNSADTFNYEYYRDHHMTSLVKLFGPDAICRIEMRQGLSSPDGSSTPAYSCSVNIYIADVDAFTAAAPGNHQKIVDDISRFTSVTPVSFQTEVLGAFNA